MTWPRLDGFFFESIPLASLQSRPLCRVPGYQPGRIDQLFAIKCLGRPAGCSGTDRKADYFAYIGTRWVPTGATRQPEIGS